MSVERETVGALADVWDRETDGIWEPITFYVGQGVRVHLSGECDALSTCPTPSRHPIEFDGGTGVIWDRVSPGPTGRGHCWRVRFSERTAGFVGGEFAPSELIPLDGSR